MPQNTQDKSNAIFYYFLFFNIKQNKIEKHSNGMTIIELII